MSPVTKACWRDVPGEGILNCFRYTGHVPGRTTTRRACQEADEMLKNLLLKQMGRLCIRDPMAVDEFICNAVDEATEMEEISAEDLLSDVVNDAFLNSAQDDNEEEDATDTKKDCSPLEGMSTASKDEETRDQGASTYISPADLWDARLAPATKRKYESCRNVIKGWIKGDLAKEEEKLKRDGERFLDASGEIIGTQFTPAYFDEFLARKRTSVTVLFRDRKLLGRLEAMVAMESDWMKPTGIPPYVEMFAKLEETQHVVERLPDVLFDGIGKMMDDRNTGGSILTKTVLQDTLRDILQEMGVRKPQTPEAPPAASLAPKTTQEMHWWDNGVHFLPDDFNFPKIDPFGAWKLWWFGNDSLRHPPYAAINPKDLRKEVRNTFYEWRRFMTRIITEIQKTTKTPVLRIRSELQAEGLFKIGMSSIPLKQSSRKRRCAQLTLTTTLRLAREAKYESNPDYCPKAFVPRKKKTAGSTIGREVTTS
ncbi:hypothetical protein BBJ28_00013389 [Nothophytophthora sp. Chile5]|nr:hypothetical protein BBJ28_00013389 [Nothophytophthora sp. Chile5]